MTQLEEKKILENAVSSFEEYPQYHDPDCDINNERGDDQDEFGRLCTCGLTKAFIEVAKELIEEVRKEESDMPRYEHIVVNITMPGWELDRFKSLPEQILEHYEAKGYELCAVDDIYYFFKKRVS